MFWLWENVVFWIYKRKLDKSNIFLFKLLNSKNIRYFNIFWHFMQKKYKCFSKKNFIILNLKIIFHNHIECFVIFFFKFLQFVFKHANFFFKFTIFFFKFFVNFLIFSCNFSKFLFCVMNFSFTFFCSSELISIILSLISWFSLRWVSKD